jgi:triphosphoribosyl-dephospho-CoA synthase
MSVDLAAMIRTACIWEATARKAGNVHPERDFADLTYLDFLVSADAIAPALAEDLPVGERVLQAIRETRKVVATNTNLGIVLLLAPLAAVPQETPLRPGVEAVLRYLDVADSRAVFEAIRLAVPGGIGEVETQDVRDEPTLPLRDIMALAQDRDLIARQYANGFADVFDLGVPALLGGLRRGHDLETAIQGCHLHWLATLPDSLILRKRGRAEADEACRRARAVLKSGWPGTNRDAYVSFDVWLRGDGHARNPGTSADLVAACLFVALREGELPHDTPMRRV